MFYELNFLMKKMTKKLLIASGALTICTGAVLNFLLARQPQNQFSDLTLADIETFAVPCQESIEIQGPLIFVTVCDRSTSFWDTVRNTPCASAGDGSCSFSNAGRV